MKRRSAKTDVVLGILAILVGVLYWALIPFAVPQEHAAMGVTGRFFPQFAAIMVAGAGAALVISTLIARSTGSAEAPPGITIDQLRRVIPYIVITAVYILLIDVLGYLVSTVIALAVLLLFSGMRNWLQFAAVVVMIPAGLYLLFRFVLLVPLPEGMLL